jgi:hypothetical protein
MTTRKIKENLEQIDKRLANAEAYLARNVNVEGSSWLHLDDWNGNSGHPLWMQNVMIPRTKQARARLEKLLERIVTKEKDKRIGERRRKMLHTRYELDS